MECCIPKVLVASLNTAEPETLLKKLGYDVRCASDGRQALVMCEEELPDAVLADGILPGIDGFALAKRIRALNIARKPGIIIMHLPGMARPFDLPGTAVIEKPVKSDVLSQTIESVAVGKRRPDAVIIRKLSLILDELGIPEHPGRRYLAEAAFLAGENSFLLSRLTQRLYPMVAMRFDTDANAVERAMRRVIEDAWRSGSIENQYRIFGNTIDAAKGKPTCGGMIAQMTEMLRRED